jgi:hypothetical protein
LSRFLLRLQMLWSTLDSVIYLYTLATVGVAHYPYTYLGGVYFPNPTFYCKSYVYESKFEIRFKWILQCET